MPQWLSDIVDRSSAFMPHGHCYLWIPSLLWLHVLSDLLIGLAYLGISLLLYLLVRKIRLPFSPVFIAFGLFIGLCGLTHFMSVWTVWNPDYFADGLLKAATAAASVATAIGLLYVRPQIEAVVHTARLSEERRIKLESTYAELEALFKRVKQQEELKSQFFANVSHELRTPLALILGPAERMQMDSNLTDEQRQALRVMNANAKTLLKQVNDLLDVAKIEAGKMRVDYAHLDAAAWFRRIASQFEVAADQRRIKFHATAPDTLEAEFDPSLMERVYINLLGNAFKFTPQGGRIEAELKAEGDDLILSITDTGPGIADEEHQSIFERFRQAEGGSTRTHGGTGLGLAIVKDFVELHRGRIGLRSRPGAGSTFTVHLPRRAPQQTRIYDELHAPNLNENVAADAALHELTHPASPADESFATSADRPTVLVVEDNADMRRFIATSLASTYNVVVAQDGREGLDRAQALRPDLIITDIMMPRMSGDQLVAAIRSSAELDAVPILLASAKGDDELRVRLLREGAQDYIVKPFNVNELMARAANLVALKRTGDELRGALASASNNTEELARDLALRHSQLRVALDTAQVAKEQAQRAREVKSQFLALVSHELRTPISTAQMNLQLLDRLLHERVPEWFSGVLDRLKRANRHMSTLIEGLLEYTRIESGRVETKPETLDGAALARAVVETHADANSENVHVSYESHSDRLLLTSDTRLLRVILDNLVSNALKFTKQGRVTLRVRSDGGTAVFEVEDTGVGIPQADLGRIFLPFEQLEPVKRKNIPGVGLGLALVKQLVEILGGRVEVNSEPGHGSTFRVLLPVSGPPHHSKELAGVAGDA